MIRNLSSTSLAAFLAAFAAFTFAAPAFADAPPLTACGPSAQSGDPCTTAGMNNDEDGICALETCSSSHPLPDGGFQTSTYPCLLCELTDAGPPDSGPSADSGADSGPTPPPPEDAGPTQDAGPTPPPASDSGSTAGDSGSSSADGNKELASSSSCSVGFAGAPGGAGLLLALGGAGAIVSGLARRRRKG